MWQPMSLSWSILKVERIITGFASNVEESQKFWKEPRTEQEFVNVCRMKCGKIFESFFMGNGATES